MLPHLFTAQQIFKLESLEGIAKINCAEKSSCDKQHHDVRILPLAAVVKLMLEEEMSAKMIHLNDHSLF